MLSEMPYTPGMAATMMKRATWSGALFLTAVLFTGCGATPIVMKNPRTDQVIVCDGGARAREVWAQTYADRCAEQLERDGWIRLRH